MRSRLTPLAVAGCLALAACGGGETEPTTDEAETPTLTAAPEAVIGAEAAANGVTTSVTDLGTILVDPDGFTMYVFTNDTDGASNCYDECAASWPPVPGDSPIGDSAEGSMFGTIIRTDGGEQLTVNGQPLYLYAADENPGDVNGQDVNGVWFVVGADGVKVGGSAPMSQPEEEDQGRSTQDYGYDY